MTREPLMMKLIRILTKYLMKSPKMGRKWELKMPRTEAEKARLIEKDKPIITDELKSQDKKKIKHNVDKSRLIGERQSNLKKQKSRHHNTPKKKASRNPMTT